MQTTSEEIENTAEHPRIVLIGSIEKNVKCYLRLYGYQYEFDNVLTAIEACFHFFIGLNIEYPVECENVWIFFEKYIFGVNKTKASFANIDLFIKSISK